MLTQSIPELPPNITRIPRPMPVRLVPHDAGIWQVALTRGQELRLAVEKRESVDVCGIVMTGYAVYSRSIVDPAQGVAVSRDWEGDVYTICECAAGKEGQPCIHSAVAVEDAGLWPFPIASQAEMRLTE